ncbi:lysophospholipase I [Trametes sanguinea]|nr:lysophospholipase I [Trametes sanguinea]
MATNGNTTESTAGPRVIHPRETHHATVIFAHGLGQRADSWVSTLQRVVERLPSVKWILPQAPTIPVTATNHANRGRPSWFEITELPPCNCYDEVGIASSIATIENLLTCEVQSGTEPGRIVLAGFSQGAALSLMTSLTTLHELGGVASLSGWIPQSSRQAMLTLEPSLPVFWAHGKADKEVPFSYAEDGTAFLRDGLHIPESNIVLKSYEGLEHEVNDAEMDDFSVWLSHILA